LWVELELEYYIVAFSDLVDFVLKSSLAPAVFVYNLSAIAGNQRVDFFNGTYQSLLLISDSGIQDVHHFIISHCHSPPFGLWLWTNQSRDIGHIIPLSGRV